MRTIFFGGRDYIPDVVLAQFLGLCSHKLKLLMENIDENDYGVCNYTIIEESNIYRIIDKEHKHLFDPDSTEERVCFDKTYVSLILLEQAKQQMVEIFKVDRLRRVI